MKLVIAMMQHETNTFSSIPTDWRSFGDGLGQKEPVQGRQVVDLLGGTGTAIGAFIDMAIARGCEIVTPIAAYAEPSGKVSQPAFDRIADIICEAVGNGCDAVLLDLHGAMVTTDFDDGEGELLNRIRAVDPHAPIGVALDFHTNLSGQLVENATVITGYRTYPHVDMYETGERCARTLFRHLDGEVAPKMVWGRLPLLTAMVRQDPSKQPMLTPMTRARSAEADGSVLNASIFGGFPLADIPEVGLSAIVVSDGDDPTGPALLAEILSDAWRERAGFTFEAEPLPETITRAKHLNGGPVLLADHGDNCGAGGSVDDMSVIAEALKQGLEGILAGPIHDPIALETMRRAGVGSTVTMKVGGRNVGNGDVSEGRSLELTGQVTSVSEGRFILEGEMMAGFPFDLHGCAVLDTGPLRLLISGKRVEPYVPQFFTQAGIDPSESRYIIVKSRQHFRAGFEPIVKHVLLARGNGACDEDYQEKHFTQLDRPMFPLDPDAPYRVISSDAN